LVGKSLTADYTEGARRNVAREDKRGQVMPERLAQSGHEGKAGHPFRQIVVDDGDVRRNVLACDKLIAASLSAAAIVR
jgi:hypothetical protein